MKNRRKRERYQYEDADCDSARLNFSERVDFSDLVADEQSSSKASHAVGKSAAKVRKQQHDVCIGQQLKVIKKKPRRKRIGTEDAKTSCHTGIHFSDLRLCRPLLRAVAENHYESPTSIQRDVIPLVLEGRDVLVSSATGSGKTASFLLPILERLCQNPRVRLRQPKTSRGSQARDVATTAMVLLPTRELAMQCDGMIRALAKHTCASHQIITGGYSVVDQASTLRQQPDIVIATPGRILDHLLNSQSVHLELLEIIVLDEADRLLDLGFRSECLQVLSKCPKSRQTLLFSATVNDAVQDFAAEALVNPICVEGVGSNQVAQTLTQEFVRTPSEDMRLATLMSLCARYRRRVLIFCSTRRSVHRLGVFFGFCGWRFAELHSGLTQEERKQAMCDFQAGTADFLLATDLAARGLDFRAVDTVVNFHIPSDASRYIHRVGRTARMGRMGLAVTIYSAEEYTDVKAFGKLCCKTQASKVLLRKVSEDSVQGWDSRIRKLASEVDGILEDEAVEHEFMLADMLLRKSDNLMKHQKTIQTRPAKEWFISNKEKRKVRRVHNS